MKRRTIATVMSLFVPGSGLWYLHRKSAAVINLALAILIPTLIGLFWTTEYIHYVLLAVAAGSAGYAHAVGTRYSVVESARR